MKMKDLKSRYQNKEDVTNELTEFLDKEGIKGYRELVNEINANVKNLIKNCPKILELSEEDIPLLIKTTFANNVIPIQMFGPRLSKAAIMTLQECIDDARDTYYDSTLYLLAEATVLTGGSILIGGVGFAPTLSSILFGLFGITEGLNTAQTIFQLQVDNCIALYGGPPPLY